MISKREEEEMRQPQRAVTITIGDAPVTFSSIDEAVKNTGNIYWDIRVERWRQDLKWGQQDHSPELWLAILAEEVGEAAQEVLTKRVGEAGNGHGNIREELVQAAAVLVAWIEQIDREDGAAP